MPIPSSRQVGRISSSIPRETSEYSICRSATGWVACARRIVSGPTSDRPTWRTYPASTSSAIAPTVSSLGTAGSRPPCRLAGAAGAGPPERVEVDVVGAETRERVAERVLHRGRPAVEAEDLPARRASHAELHARHPRAAIV